MRSYARKKLFEAFARSPKMMTQSEKCPIQSSLLVFPLVFLQSIVASLCCSEYFVARFSQKNCQSRIFRHCPNAPQGPSDMVSDPEGKHSPGRPTTIFVAGVRACCINREVAAMRGSKDKSMGSGGRQRANANANLQECTITKPGGFPLIWIYKHLSPNNCGNGPWNKITFFNPIACASCTTSTKLDRLPTISNRV